MYAIPNVMNKVLPLLAVIDGKIVAAETGIGVNATAIVSNYNSIAANAAAIAAKGWVNRGSGDTYDWADTDLTKDGNWHDLDLTSIMPAGASLVLVRVAVGHTGVLKRVCYRTKGVDLVETSQYIDTHYVAMTALTASFMLQPDSNGIIQYKFVADDTWLLSSLRIMGWLK